MPLTKLWTSVLALLAAACLAGMFLLSLDASNRATRAQKAVVQTVTDAAVAALSADISASPVNRGSSLLRDSRLSQSLIASQQELLTKSRHPETLQADLEDKFNLVANETLLRDVPGMSVALVDDNSGAEDTKLITSTGVDAALFEALLATPAFAELKKLPANSPPTAFVLNEGLYSVALSHPAAANDSRRILSIHAVDTGGSSHLRRVLGTSYAASFVHKDSIIGEKIGEVLDQDFLDMIVNAGENVPRERASETMEVGKVPTQRVGAVARVPGPIGEDTFISVVARDALRPPKDVARALGDASRKGLAQQLPWELLGAVLLFSLILALYLPHLESTGPLRRMTSELRQIASGQQQQIFPDAYSGIFSQLAQAAADAHQHVRDTWNQELNGDGYDEAADAKDESSTAQEQNQNQAEGRSASDSSSQASGPRPTFAPPPEPAAHPAAGPTGSQAATSTSNGVKNKTSPSVIIDPSKTGYDVQPGPAPAHDPSADRESYYRKLYEDFIATKKQCGESIEQLTYERLATKLRKNTEDLMKRDGTKDVTFTVYVKEGKAALKAKIVR